METLIAFIKEHQKEHSLEHLGYDNHKIELS